MNLTYLTDDNPCLDEQTNYCFLNETCVNNVWPQTGIRCADCPLGEFYYYYTLKAGVSKIHNLMWVRGEGRGSPLNYLMKLYNGE